MENELLYKDEVYQIIGVAIDVHKELESGFLESVYEEAQIINYLKATKMKIGLLINFGSHGRLEWKRFIKTD